MLDERGTALISDPLNLRILRELVFSDYSVSELSRKFRTPTLKIWRRVQKLLAAGLIELSKTAKVNNIEKKLYRAVATNYIPQQFLEAKPKDVNLAEAYKIFVEIQKGIMLSVSKLQDIPDGTEPIDYAIYANMLAFAQVCGDSKTQEMVSELKQRLSEFEATVSSKPGAH
ncbi:MAG: winged helix-turn-helix transcriptional regulator [Nitrososphaerota archaeon]|nr:winged helix-turn-helix transcriptional regulator [Nitrososphaerota archaeon]